MINNSLNLQKLIVELSSLPGIGKKSAGRPAYYIANADKEKMKSLSDAIKNANENIKHCKICYTLSDDDICSICKSDNRNKKIIMVVENERDMLAYENTGEYKGVYHVLGGAISPLLGIGPNELKMRTWERGNGETLACGTGACAAAIAAVLNGFSPINQDITVKVRGGSLIVKYTGETVYLTGNTTICFEGEVEI